MWSESDTMSGQRNQCLHQPKNKMKSLLGLNRYQSRIKNRKIKSQDRVIHSLLLAGSNFYFHSHNVAPDQASANPKLVLLFRSVAVKRTPTDDTDSSHKAVTEKKHSMKINNWCELHFFVLCCSHCIFLGIPVTMAWQGVLSPTRKQHFWGTQPSQCPPECSLIQPRYHPEASLSEELWISPSGWDKFPSFTEPFFRISVRQTEQKSFKFILW